MKPSRKKKKHFNLLSMGILFFAFIGLTIFAGNQLLNAPKTQQQNSLERSEGKNPEGGKEPEEKKPVETIHKNTVIFGETQETKREGEIKKEETQKPDDTGAQSENKVQSENKAQSENKTQKEEGQQEQTQKQEESVKDFIPSPSFDQEIANRFSYVQNSSNSIHVMLNKKNGLPDGFKPQNLVVPKIDFPFSHDTPKKYMRAEAAQAIEKLFEAAKSQGHDIYGISGYRSYETQKSLYEMYVKKDGKEAADRYSSKPGYSEHQSGLVMDVSSKAGGFDLQESFGDLPEGRWIADNAHKYGFIVRYLKDKVDITGYDYEPWHLRYVGEEVATFMYERGICYEEFYDLIGVAYHR